MDRRESTSQVGCDASCAARQPDGNCSEHEQRLGPTDLFVSAAPRTFNRSLSTRKTGRTVQRFPSHKEALYINSRADSLQSDGAGQADTPQSWCAGQCNALSAALAARGSEFNGNVQGAVAESQSQHAVLRGVKECSGESLECLDERLQPEEASASDMAQTGPPDSCNRGTQEAGVQAEVGLGTSSCTTEDAGTCDALAAPAPCTHTYDDSPGPMDVDDPLSGQAAGKVRGDSQAGTQTQCLVDAAALHSQRLPSGPFQPAAAADTGMGYAGLSRGLNGQLVAHVDECKAPAEECASAPAHQPIHQPVGQMCIHQRGNAHENQCLSSRSNNGAVSAPVCEARLRDGSRECGSCGDPAGQCACEGGPEKVDVAFTGQPGDARYAEGLLEYATRTSVSAFDRGPGGGRRTVAQSVVLDVRDIWPRFCLLVMICTLHHPHIVPPESVHIDWPLSAAAPTVTWTLAKAEHTGANLSAKLQQPSTSPSHEALKRQRGPVVTSVTQQVLLALAKLHAVGVYGVELTLHRIHVTLVGDGAPVAMLQLPLLPEKMMTKEMADAEGLTPWLEDVRMLAVLLLNLFFGLQWQLRKQVQDRPIARVGRITIYGWPKEPAGRPFIREETEAVALAKDVILSKTGYTCDDLLRQRFFLRNLPLGALELNDNGVPLPEARDAGVKQLEKHLRTLRARATCQSQP